ncbi:hypothetical protein [Sporomusa aerivorans]|uniref:hypothetical protein n=1 Tax=Sporomusa aerivorans TaxID=204936 RepID=UPI00352A3111
MIQTVAIIVKKKRFSTLADWAITKNYKWVLEGSNADDVNDYRPGMRAIHELETVRSPLLELGFSKQDIRDVSKEWGLPTFNKPSAACLSSRIAYGLPITSERMRQVEVAEEILKKYFTGQVRVRYHDNLARIEIEDEQMSILDNKDIVRSIVDNLKNWDLRLLHWIFPGT